ncbi:hypothetical protein AGMMS50267_13560 [Spirochaetia bacterium]|nr:hypothetical protein AGMMS50267_13560 [Spirochaetia bacterium]
MNHRFVRQILLLVILLAGSAAPLFAEIGGGFKFEVGVDGLYIPFSGFTAYDTLMSQTEYGYDYDSSSDTETYTETYSSSSYEGPKGMALPLLTLGLYGHVDFGPVHLGAGFQGYSLIIAGVFWPVVYAELELGKFTINATVGGYSYMIHAVYMPMFFVEDFIVPDVSIWFTHKHVKFGVGAITLMDARGVPKFFSDFSTDNLLFYAGIRWVVPFSKD